MLRYDRQIKPGLVALYDIRPGNTAGLFLQPWSLHAVHGAGEQQKTQNVLQEILFNCKAVVTTMI